MAVGKPIDYLYNPANQTMEELIERFVIRQGEFKLLRHDLATTELGRPPQHYLVQGLRGAGKTTLLLRLAYEIKRDKAMSRYLLPVIFNEELYRVNRLERFWEAVIDQMDDPELDLLEQEHHVKNPTDREEALLEAILVFMRQKGKQAVLFLENAGDVLGRFDIRDRQRLREVLMTRGELRLIASSPMSLSNDWDYDDPFYEFFKTLRLKGLNKKDTFTLLKRLADTHGDGRIHEVIEKNPGRIEAMRRLTGGLPRTVVLLYEVFRDDRGDSVAELNYYLDRVTPLYKHRIEALPPQQQEIIDVIAIAWDAVTAGEISEKIRLPSKTISAQLKKMADNGMVTRLKTGTKNHLYLLSERFFNIWYLMRCGSRRDQQRVIWLVRFLQEWCDDAALKERAERHLTAIQTPGYHPQHAFLLTQALAHTGKLDVELEKQLIEQTRTILVDSGSELAHELSEPDLEIFSRVAQLIKVDKYNQAEQMMLEIKNPVFKHVFYALFYGHQEQVEKYISMVVGEPENLITCAWVISPMVSYSQIQKLVRAYFDAGKVNEKSLYLFLQVVLSLELYQLLDSLFEDTKYNLKERYKPYYYAFLHLKGGDNSKVTNHMGPELEETVREILSGVEKVRQAQSGARSKDAI
ncbi:MAG: AAA family ATPase [Acidobacteriota bacterium]|nr:AAA family ATPase [Acidobacteriota bacterium]